MKINSIKTDIFSYYRTTDAIGRLSLMLNNYAVFPKVIRKAEMKVQYQIKSEQEFLRSHSRDELGIRVQNSNLSNPTFEEAEMNTMIESATKAGEIDWRILKGITNANKYIEEIHIIKIMRMDFELLQNIIENLDERDNKTIKQYILEGKFFKEIAEEEGRSYEAIKKRMDRIRLDIQREMIEYLEMNCRGGK